MGTCKISYKTHSVQHAGFPFFLFLSIYISFVASLALFIDNICPAFNKSHDDLRDNIQKSQISVRILNSISGRKLKFNDIVKTTNKKTFRFGQRRALFCYLKVTEEHDNSSLPLIFPKLKLFSPIYPPEHISLKIETIYLCIGLWQIQGIRS